MYPYQRDRRIDRRAFRRGGRLGRERRGAFPDLYPAVERTALFRGMYGDGRVLRMVPGQEGGAARPDRGHTL